jgi:hypothetical protein
MKQFVFTNVNNVELSLQEAESAIQALISKFNIFKQEGNLLIIKNINKDTHSVFRKIIEVFMRKTLEGLPSNMFRDEIFEKISEIQKLGHLCISDKLVESQGKHECQSK